MTQFLPPNLLALFAPRDPIPFLPPVDKLPHEKKSSGYIGLANFLHDFEDPKDTPPPTRVETRDERRERKRREKQEQVAYRLEQDIALWDPTSLANGTTDPFKTLFIARINYDTSESKLRREFEVYGPIKKIVLVHSSSTGKPRGYAFIEYEHERDMHSAYKHADGKKIDSRRVLVDVERSRTVKGWLPRRLGGGLGGTRRGGPDVNVKYSGREDERGHRGGGGGERIERERNEREESVRERRRSRSREKRHRSRSRDREGRKRRRSRSRSRERGERRRHRSRSRERRERRDRDRERRERRDRDRANGAGDEFDPTRVKQEPEDDYPEYPSTGDANAPLKDEDKKPRHLLGQPPPPPPPPPPPAGGDGNGAQQTGYDGEIDY